MFTFQHSRKKTIRGWVTLYDFPDNPTICPVQSLRDYMARTDTLHNANAHSIFVALTKPHRSVSAQTVAHWIKDLMGEAGIDTDMFKQHSVRSASAAWLGSAKALSAKQICKIAQWSGLTTTYEKFYRRVVLQTAQQ